MNRASRWGTLALAVAFVGVATASLSDTGFPPPRYDLGGRSEAETLSLARELFPDVPLIRAPLKQVIVNCDRLNRQRWNQPYLMSEGERLLGCLIQGRGDAPPVIVYPYDWKRPWLTNQILRHELGHLMGWPPEHRRD